MYKKFFSKINTSTDIFRTFQIRLGIGIYGCAFLAIGMNYNYFPMNHTGFSYLLICYILNCFLGLLIPGPSKISSWRRYRTDLIDISFLSWAILLSADGIPYFWIFYILLSFTYSARYGFNVAFFNMIVMLFQYNFLLLFSNLWQQIPLILLSQMVVLVYLPFYIHNLLFQLHKAKQDAEQQTHSKSKFLAFMTHEIRNPLNAIIGSVHLLEKTELTEKQKKYLRGLSYSSQFLRGLLDDILDFSKLEAKKLELNLVDFDLRQSMEQLIECFKSQAKQSLQVKFSDDLPHYIQADRQRLQQVLINLISNALKCTDQLDGQVLLQLSVQSVSDQTGICHINFEVTDNGVGIDEQAQKILFEHYTQIAEASPDATRPTGTGLGTTITKELVEMMGGKIQLYSQKGVGSTFYFNLPLQTLKQISINSESSLETTNLTNSLHVLVAEDDEINAMVSEQFLKDLGHSVDMVRDGKQALKRLKRSQYDMIFMDMHMPHATGVQVARQFRQTDTSTPIIGVTANATIEHRDACIAAGMSDFLSKPITPEKLSAIILKNITLQRA